MGWRACLRLGLCAAGLALVPTSAQPGAATVAPDPLAAALALPVAGELAGARDAARFAWVENEAGVRNIWVADRGRPSRRLTDFAQDDGRPLSDLAFSDDGASLAFVRGGDPEFPDDPLPNPASEASPPPRQLFVVSPDGGVALRIGDGHSPAFAPAGNRLAYTRQGEIWLWERGRDARRLATVRGEVRRLQWSPDGTRLLFVDHRGDYSFIALLDPASARLLYLDAGLGFSVEPVFSPDGRQVAFIRYIEPPAGATADGGPYWSIRVADAATGAAHVLWTAPPGAGARYQETRGRDLFWSADGRLVFPWERSGWLHAYALDAARGGAPRELTPGDFEVETFLLGADGRSLVYAANADDLNRRHIWRRLLAGGAAERVTGGRGIESAPTLGGTALAAIATDATHPAHPVLAGPGLSPLGRKVSAPGFVAPEAVRFRAGDGIEMHGQLFRARGSGRRPALVYVHGGPRRQMLLGFHPSNYYSHAYVLNQHFAARGYHVLAVNYRSGTGYGAAFREAPGIAREGGAEYRDVLAAGRWLAARGDVDPARIGIWGGSWGGYLAALALARDSDLFAAGVDFHGVHSMLRPLASTLSPAAQAAARQLQWDSSPLAAIERWRSPVLLVHGDDDRNVDFSQSLLLARELAARRIPFRELVFPNERHSFLIHAHWLASFRAADAFLEEELMRKRPRP
ncbi:MAG TPA: prolyl oligopeptidase family serine peptidase [Allosphingosinicella sp.]|nr:prolyl oligopeptidase family serine peptidase [Allosphingosinicella sp.]